MPFFIREEKYCPTCGLPTDQCECLGVEESAEYTREDHENARMVLGNKNHDSFNEAVETVASHHENSFANGSDKQGEIKGNYIFDSLGHAILDKIGICENLSGVARDTGYLRAWPC